MGKKTELDDHYEQMTQTQSRPGTKQKLERNYSSLKTAINLNHDVEEYMNDYYQVPRPLNRATLTSGASVPKIDLILSEKASRVGSR